MRIETNPLFSDLRQVYAAGMLEGYVTSERIFQYKTNLWGRWFPLNPPSAPLLKFFDDQRANVRRNITSYANSDSFWFHMGLVMSQFDGLVKGYWDATLYDPSKKLAEVELYIMNSAGDLGAVYTRYQNVKDFILQDKSMLECSALVKNTGKGMI